MHTCQASARAARGEHRGPRYPVWHGGRPAAGHAHMSSVSASCARGASGSARLLELRKFALEVQAALDLRLLLLREVAAREQRVNRAELLHDRAAALRSGVRGGRVLSDGALRALRAHHDLLLFRWRHLLGLLLDLLGLLLD